MSGSETTGFYITIKRSLRTEIVPKPSDRGQLITKSFPTGTESFLVGKKMHLLGSVFSKIRTLQEDLAILLYVTLGFLFIAA